MYVNTGGDARDGEAFILVKRDGREDHIYGTGKDRKVVSAAAARPRRRTRRDATDKTSLVFDASKAPKNETTKPVDGRAYADILTGSRTGLYLNTSGNVRDGDVFALVKREGREFHIYGTGKDRQVIGLKKPATHAADDRHDATTTTTTPVRPARRRQQHRRHGLDDVNTT